MMVIKASILLMALALVSAAPDGHYGHHHHSYGHHGHHGHDYHEPAHYHFGYKVHDHANFGHTETRHGHHTQGQYHVHLPDGRLQTVDYHVGDGHTGYNADVTYSHGHH